MREQNEALKDAKPTPAQPTPDRVHQLLNLVAAEAKRFDSPKLLDITIDATLISECRAYHAKLNTPAFLQISLDFEKINKLQPEWNITKGTNIKSCFFPRVSG